MSSLPQLELKFYQEVIIIAISGLLSLYNHFLSKRQERALNIITQSQVYSIRSFYNNLDDKNENVIIEGKFKSSNPNYDYGSLDDNIFLVTPMTKNFFTEFIQKYIFFNFRPPRSIQIRATNFSPIYNWRKGGVEKHNWLAKELSNPLLGLKLTLWYSYIFSSNNLLQSQLNNIRFMTLLTEIKPYHYLINDDMIGAFGKKHREQNNYSFSFEYLYQGNKHTLVNLLKKEIRFSNKFSIWSGLIFLIGATSLIYKNAKKYLDANYKQMGGLSTSKPFQRVKENCSMCLVRYANVVMTECNHFNLCYECFIRQNKKCIICNTQKSDYIIVELNQNLVN